MIVKIKKEDGWVFLDKVNKAEIQTKNQKLEEVYEFGSPTIIESTEKNVNKLNLFIKFSDFRQENYLIDSEVYLLNDEGKTIERIN